MHFHSLYYAALIMSHGYESDHTKFMRELLTKKPELAAEQRKGRAIWWDKKPLDMKELGEQDAAKVPQQPYPYATK